MADPRQMQVRFGPFVCDMRTGELWKAGRAIKLQEQPRQLLVALLQHPGKVLSRDELRRRLWADDTFVDFDNAMNVGIRRIREALGDVAPAPRYIETVRGHGYRFVAPVLHEQAPDPGAAVAVPEPGPAPALTASRHALFRPAMLVGVVAALAAAFAVVRSASHEPRIGSVAVVPLDNLLADEDRQYLVDSLSEAITQRLADRVEVRVIASRSAFALRDHNVPRSDIARRLGADALVVGNVTRAGAGVVINVRLVEARNDRTRWAGRFERSFDELSLPDEIVEAVARGVSSTAPLSTRPRIVRAVAPEARDAYLRGRFFWARRGQANAVTAVRYLSTAIQLQPDYAEAWAGLADVYAVNEGEPSPAIVPWPGDSIEGGIRAAREALRLAPPLGEAHAALGKLFVAKRHWTAAERSFARAVELSPQYSTARQWYGTMLARLGRCDEALEHVALAARLDPLTTMVNEAVGSVYLDCGEPQRAIAVFDSVLVMHPTSDTTRNRRALAFSRLGRHDEAVHELEALATASPGDGPAGVLAVAYAKAGHAVRARSLLEQLTAPFPRARAFAALGDADQMWPMLERALAEHSVELQNLLTVYEFAPYRQHPRFIDFAGRAGFPLPLKEGRFSTRAKPLPEPVQP